jgi:hypothetical protein
LAEGIIRAQEPANVVVAVTELEAKGLKPLDGCCLVSWVTDEDALGRLRELPPFWSQVLKESHGLSYDHGFPLEGQVVGIPGLECIRVLLA